MSEPTKIESLELEVKSSSDSAANGIKALSSSLSKLKNALASFDDSSISKFDSLSNSLSKLSELGKIKISASIGNQLKSISEAAASFEDNSITTLDSLSDALSKLSVLNDIKISASIGNQLKSISEAASMLADTDYTGIENLPEALAPLNNLSKADGLKSFITQLKKLPELEEVLNSINWDEFTQQMQQFSTALAPLASQLNIVSNAFSCLPTNITRVATATNTVVRANKQAKTSYVNLWAKFHVFISGLSRISRTIATFIEKSYSYTENLNLFSVSMGRYADEAKRYAEMVGEAMGIDPGEWMRNQGVFMTIVEGFGVVSDRAYIMSKNLTQLGYDLSSLFNDSFETAMQKLQSGISGELEPLRRWGFDLSQAKLQAIALALGIDKTFSSMTQAEKAQLRYYAIMTQVTNAQGDMSRTLDAPANQLRILKAQVTQCARALGNIFIPALNAILPYAIAVVKVIRMVAEAIASLVGFSLPEVDYSGITSGSDSIADSWEDATEEAKKYKNTVLGIDELNIMNGKDSASDAMSGLSDGFDFMLPEYDFIEGLTKSRVDEIVEKMKEWLGITREIDSWAELFDTRLGDILKVVGVVGGAFLAWKITSGVVDFITNLPSLLKSISGTLTILAFAIEFSGAYDIGKNGLNLKNGLRTALGAAFGVGLSLLTFGTGPLGWTIGITAALTVGLIGYFEGKEAKLQEQYENSEAYKELQAIREDLEKSWEITKQIKLDIQADYDKYQAVTDKFVDLRALVERAFDLSDIEFKTPEQLAELETLVDTINGFKLNGLQLTFDKTTGKILETRDAILQVIDSLEAQARMEAAHDILVDIYKRELEQQRVYDNLMSKQADLWDKRDAAKQTMDDLSAKISALNVQNNNTPLWGKGKLELLKELSELRDEWKIAEKEYKDIGKLIGENFRGTVETEENLKSLGKETKCFTDEYVKYFAEVSKTNSDTANSFEDMKNTTVKVFEAVEAQSSKSAEAMLSDLSKVSKAFSEISGTRGLSLSVKPQMVSLQGFANGGFPTSGEMFIAREAGPELVGTIGGRTAVANNDDIVNSVAQGVADANAEQTALLREQNRYLKALLEKDQSHNTCASRDILSQIERKNRRDGKTVIPIGI